jgi:hypothetical protein
MNFFLSLVLWTLLFVLCWPVALLLLVALPVLWLLSLPFRLLGAVVHGILAFIGAVFLLPARLLGYRSA